MLKPQQMIAITLLCLLSAQAAQAQLVPLLVLGGVFAGGALTGSWIARHRYYPEITADSCPVAAPYYYNGACHTIRP